jgi:hypothetical protein
MKIMKDVYICMYVGFFFEILPSTYVHAMHTCIHLQLSTVGVVGLLVFKRIINHLLKGLCYFLTEVLLPFYIGFHSTNVCMYASKT